ncbi:hypothetical protein [Pseudomonas coronafaciens]|uniref:hypothetical protein n=1 Tax=Pseudomonas coronafaciens TaxID=53409 RepID=UPI0005A4D413|nr:hypothetical protein [Pseudomonas coronafaciens]KGS15480.1 hypothetical protein OA77_05560 [Pseudomonas coronafaciens]
MSQHIRFDAATGKMTPRSVFGKYTEELLQLNDGTQVEFRKTTLHALKIANKELNSLKDQNSQILKLLKKGSITKEDFDAESSNIADDISLTETLIQNLTGTKLPLPLKKSRFGVPL